MKRLKQIIPILRYNLWTLVGFEAVLKVLTLMVFGPLVAWLMKEIMSLTGYTYLTFENLVAFLWNPLTIILLAGLVVFVVLYTLFDMITVIVILDQSCQRKRIQIVRAIRTSLRKCGGVLRRRNWGFVGWTLLMMPFISVGVATSFLTTLRVPSFILEFIWENRWLAVLVGGVIVAWMILLIRWIYALHYYVVDGKPFREAIKASVGLSKKGWGKSGLIVVVMQVLLTVVYLAVTVVGILVVMLVARVWGGNLADNVVVGAIWVLITMTFMLAVIFALPICFATVSFLFYQQQLTQGEKIEHLYLKQGGEGQRREMRMVGMIWTLVVLAVLECAVFNYRFKRGDYNAVLTQLVGTEVTAHRGASAELPENTMLAFREASRLGADYIELDVQMTRDGEIVVAHDRNLARVAGVKKNVDEMTWAEIQELEVGSYLGEEFRGEKIPTLREVVHFAKEAGLKMNIELKETEADGFVERVIEVVDEEEFRSGVVISSGAYELLEQVEEMAGELVTIYVMGMMYGNVLPLSAADGFSLEASNITLEFVNAAHEAGKVVYAWTVNSEDKIWRMVEIGVDNIVTDNVTLAQDVMSQNRTSGFINEYMRLVRGVLWW